MTGYAAMASGQWEEVTPHGGQVCIRSVWTGGTEAWAVYGRGVGALAAEYGALKLDRTTGQVELTAPSDVVENAALRSYSFPTAAAALLWLSRQPRSLSTALDDLLAAARVLLTAWAHGNGFHVPTAEEEGCPVIAALSAAPDVRVIA